MREEHFMRSGSANVFFCYENTTIKAVKKVFFRKPQEKLERETRALSLLQKSSGADYFPKIIKVISKENTFYMEYCGEQLTKINLPHNWIHQVNIIISSMESMNIVNGDIDIKNLVVKNNRLYLLDFGNIRFKEDLFFEKHDYDTYKTKQHHKLQLICQALSDNKNVDNILRIYNREISNYYNKQLK